MNDNNNCDNNRIHYFPLKKFNFSMAVFQTSMKILKKDLKIKGCKNKN